MKCGDHHMSPYVWSAGMWTSDLHISILVLSAIEITSEGKQRFLLTGFRSSQLQNTWLILSYSNLSFYVILGDCSKGILLCKHADIQLRAAMIRGQNGPHVKCWLFIFLVSSNYMYLFLAFFILSNPSYCGNCHSTYIACQTSFAQYTCFIYLWCNY
jgi:hypothetical protein